MSLSSDFQHYLEAVLRAAIFGLSFFFTGTMWALYTKALSASPSAVKVNIVNTASNFIITALLGAVVFGEKLPLLWWFGAGLLVAGSVIIGKREEGGEENEGRKKRE
jgi:drug/metabolite transporter (DMT)-like permease